MLNYPGCALRALSLCDGQVLEDPERSLQHCLCRAIEHCESHGYAALGEISAQKRKRLIEEALAQP